MFTTLKPTTSRKGPYIFLTVDVLVVVVCFIAGIATGKIGYLILASGLAILVPLWFLYPISLKTPLTNQFRQGREAGGISVAATVIGLALVVIAAVITWMD